MRHYMFVFFSFKNITLPNLWLSKLIVPFIEKNKIILHKPNCLFYFFSKDDKIKSFKLKKNHTFLKFNLIDIVKFLSLSLANKETRKISNVPRIDYELFSM